MVDACSGCCDRDHLLYGDRSRKVADQFGVYRADRGACCFKEIKN